MSHLSHVIFLQLKLDPSDKCKVIILPDLILLFQVAHEKKYYDLLTTVFCV